MEQPKNRQQALEGEVKILQSKLAEAEKMIESLCLKINDPLSHESNENIDSLQQELVDCRKKVKINDKRLNRTERIAKIGFWEIDLNNNSVVASLGAKKIYGISDNEFTKNEIQQIPLPEYRATLDAALDNLIKNDIPYDVAFKIKRTDDGR
nr:PAS domain-containing protein [Bacteroidota bacterium]